MAEVGLFNQNPSPEKSSGTRVTVIYGVHIFGSDQPKGSMWDPSTQKLVEGLHPRPTVIAPDSLVFPTSWPPLEFFPSKICNHFTEPGTTVHLLGADVPQFTQKPPFSTGLYLQEKQAWDPIFDALVKIDPWFKPQGGEQNKILQDEVKKAFNIEIASSLPAGLIAGILLRLLKTRQQEGDANSRLTLDRKITRRDFLKMAGIGGLAFGLSELRVPIFNASIGHGSAETSDTFTDMIAKATKPILYHSSRVDVRNAKIGLCVLDYMEKVALPDATAAIVLGSAHKLEIFPGQLLGETVSQTKVRLLLDMVDNLDTISRVIASELPDVPREVVKAILGTLFADYDVYDFPQFDPSNSQNGESSWDLSDRRTIPEISGIIDKLVR